MIVSYSSGTKSYRLSSNNLLRLSSISLLARFNSSSIIHQPFLIDSNSNPSLNTSLPYWLGIYLPIYSSISVCWWLLILLRGIPKWFAKYVMMDVLPADVGPSNRIFRFNCWFLLSLLFYEDCKHLSISIQCYFNWGVIVYFSSIIYFPFPF